MSVKGKINVYRCDNGHDTVTICRDEGVTPFMLGCRWETKENWPKNRPCPLMGRSAFFHDSVQDRTPEWEWFSPTLEEIKKMPPAMREHVAQGGLDLRRIVTNGSSPAN